jgi:hypothetical protein
LPARPWLLVPRWPATAAATAAEIQKPTDEEATRSVVPRAGGVGYRPALLRARIESAAPRRHERLGSFWFVRHSSLAKRSRGYGDTPSTAYLNIPAPDGRTGCQSYAGGRQCSVLWSLLGPLQIKRRSTRFPGVHACAMYSSLVAPHGSTFLSEKLPCASTSLSPSCF